MGNNNSVEQNTEALNDILNKSVTNIVTSNTSTATSGTSQIIDISVIGDSSSGTDAEVDIGNKQPTSTTISDIDTEQTSVINLAATMSSIQDTDIVGKLTSDVISEVISSLSQDSPLYPTNISGDDNVINNTKASNVV